MRRATPFACNRSTISHKCRTERAKAKAEGKYRGGIPTARAKAEQVFAVVDAGKTRGEAAEELGISIRSVFRILRTRKDAEKAVTRIRTRPRVSARNVSTTLRQPAFEFKLGFPAFGLAG
jgi:DNA invertase Pin-like site-specific DNA recombinase